MSINFSIEKDDSTEGNFNLKLKDCKWDLIVRTYQEDILSMELIDFRGDSLLFESIDEAKGMAIRVDCDYVSLLNGNYISLYDIWQKVDCQISKLIRELEEEEAYQRSCESGEEHFRGLT